MYSDLTSTMVHDRSDTGELSREEIREGEERETKGGHGRAIATDMSSDVRNATVYN